MALGALDFVVVDFAVLGFAIVDLGVVGSAVVDFAVVDFVVADFGVVVAAEAGLGKSTGTNFESDTSILAIMSQDQASPGLTY